MNDIAVFRVWHGLPIPLRLVIGLAVLVAFGTALLLGVDRGLAWNEALFTTVSALTVTGLSVRMSPAACCE